MTNDENNNEENENIEILESTNEGPLSFLRESLLEEGEDCLSVL